MQEVDDDTMVGQAERAHGGGCRRLERHRQPVRCRRQAIRRHRSIRHETRRSRETDEGSAVQPFDLEVDRARPIEDEALECRMLAAAHRHVRQRCVDGGRLGTGRRSRGRPGDEATGRTGQQLGDQTPRAPPPALSGDAAMWVGCDAAGSRLSRAW